MSMNTLLRTLGVLVLALLVVCPPALAEKQPSAKIRRSAEEHQVKKNKQNLTGWDGILFYCPFHDNSGQELNDIKDICEKTYINAEFLAAAAKLNLIKAHDGYEAGFKALVDDLLVLSVMLSSTQQETPAAVHADLRVYVSYGNAVEARRWKQETKDPRETPRSGDLILWERTVIGASSSAARDLIVPMSQGIEDHLKQFFTDFLNAQR